MCAVNYLSRSWTNHHCISSQNLCSKPLTRWYLVSETMRLLTPANLYLKTESSWASCRTVADICSVCTLCILVPDFSSWQLSRITGGKKLLCEGNWNVSYHLLLLIMKFPCLQHASLNDISYISECSILPRDSMSSHLKGKIICCYYSSL